MTLVLIDLNSDDPEYVSAFIERLNEHAPEDGYEVSPSVYFVDVGEGESAAIFAQGRVDQEAGIMRRLSFYQRTAHQIQPDVGLEAEIAIGDLTLGVYRFSDDPLDAKIGGYRTGRMEKTVAVRVETFTDCMGTWRKLDAMRVFHKIERAQLKGSDDLARLLVACGLRHVPFVGYQYERDHGATEKARIKALHSTSPTPGA